MDLQDNREELGNQQNQPDPHLTKESSDRQDHSFKILRNDLLSTFLHNKTLLIKAMNNLSTCDRIKYSLFPFCMKEAAIGRLFDFAHSHIESKFDMTGLLKFIQNFEKLLQVIFTPEQRLLFDLIPSGAFLNTVNDEGGLVKSSNQLSYEDKVSALRKAKCALEAISNSSDASVTDKNLFANLGFLMNLNIGGTPKEL